MSENLPIIAEVEPAKRNISRPTVYLPPMKAQMCVMVGQGFTGPAIADRFGGHLTGAKVRSIMHNLTVEMPKERPSLRRVVAILDVPTWTRLEAEAIRYGTTIADFAAEVLTTMVRDELMVLRNLMEGRDD